MGDDLKFILSLVVVIGITACAPIPTCIPIEFAEASICCCVNSSGQECCAYQDFCTSGYVPGCNCS